MTGRSRELVHPQERQHLGAIWILKTIEDKMGKELPLILWRKRDRLILTIRDPLCSHSAPHMLLLQYEQAMRKIAIENEKWECGGSGHRWAMVSKWTRRFKGRGMKGIHEGKAEVGLDEGEDIMEKKEEEVRGRAILCLPRRMKWAGVSVQRTSTPDLA